MMSGKKKLAAIVLVLMFPILFSGCENPMNKNFDATLLEGHWQTGTLHEHYNANGTGYTWDTADDVTEDEAQPFTWSLEGSKLTQKHQMEMGGIVPKTYTVTKLSAMNLMYHDDYGKEYLFVKVKE